MATIMDQFLEPRPRWLVERRGAGEIDVVPWSPRYPAALPGPPSPHTDLHETFGAEISQDRVMGPEGKRASSSFLDEWNSRQALLEAFTHPAGVSAAKAVLDDGNTSVFRKVRLAGNYSCQFVFRDSAGVVRTSDLSLAAGVAFKLYRVGPGLAYVQTLFPLKPSDL